ncbi:ribosomal protein S19 [Acrasis kona]|uniref:Ribosomal protein S19 n=1 Tax=Acrasis kona TaxID=1008807 RepID=A0AAW2YQE3_9EUKA
MGKAITVKDVPAQKFVESYAAHLKKVGTVTLPAWVDIVKTGVHKEMPPQNPDWFYIRCAAIARNVYLRPATGVGGLRKRYGGRTGHQVRPEHHSIGSEAVARRALQELEKIGVLAKDAKNGYVDFL